MASTFMCGVEDFLISGSRFVWDLTITTLRKWYTERLRHCQHVVRTWCGLGDVYQMSEGRLCQVHLLDERNLELLVQPKLLSRELLDLVASHFNLKEKEYFGINFIDDTGQCSWLQLDRKVLEHDFSKKPGPVVLNFLVRFYIESISFLKDNTTVELFFLNAKASIYKEDIEVESETVFKLAAYTLQESKGDFVSDESARADLKKLPALPTKVLKEHPSLAYCEDRVIEHYKKLKGITRGQAIVQYLTLVESLPTYGVHYYEVKDKQGLPWWLGISYKGIGQYDLQDKVKPRKLYQWKQLENLYFREKKFAVEVNDPHRRTVSKRTFGQTGLVIHTWYANHSLIKTIWVMAISQHQFYLDRKQSKAKIPSARSLGDIAMDLTDVGAPKISKLTNLEGKNPLIMASSGSLISSGSQDSEVSEDQKKEKISELKKKEKALQDILAQKIEELKKICMREAELTGKLPKEYPLSTGDKTPTVRRRIGTAFKLDDSLPNEEDPDLQNLESRFALQQKIVEAAKKLASEPELYKTVRKTRKQNCYDAVKRLQEIENAINEYRIKSGKKPTQRASLILQDDVIPSETSSLSDSLTLDDDDSLESQKPRSRSVQSSPKLHAAQSLGMEYNTQRRASACEQQHGRERFNDGDNVQGTLQYNHREALSTHSSPYKTPARQPRDTRSMPPTPVMTRNAYSSSQLRSDGTPQHFRQRSGSLESQTQLFSEIEPEKPRFTLSPARRSNSTEVLDDGSSYTSQSSTEYHSTTSKSDQHYRTLDSRTRDKRRHRKQNMYANAGSMPNLAQNGSRHCGYQMASHQPSPAYYVAGYPPYTDCDPYSNGGYIYENGSEGHYNVNPTYRTAAYYGHERYGRYYDEQTDHLTQNPYATIRPPRSRPGAKTEHMTKHIQKALVAEHLRVWYNRNTGHKDQSHSLQAGYEYERGSQQGPGYPAVPASFSQTSRAPSVSSVSSANSTGTWRSQVTVGLTDYDVPLFTQQPYVHSYSDVYSSMPSHSRSYIDVNQMENPESNPLENSLDPDDQLLYWHEDSKPGTIV
ncbi:FERM domain-containing protein 4B-like isoform X1 [Acipenser ruthenus]|uniref:FERM domain-containing protein 4B-like isoform X1 n=2 Tax=Acipenser ruthenus TaxID=7906 RepID=UPI00155F89C9|nr:FERM domain-containing protein 4B-like isoform X1 [Acipenser ruthenus]